MLVAGRADPDQGLAPDDAATLRPAVFLGDDDVELILVVGGQEIATETRHQFQPHGRPQSGELAQQRGEMMGNEILVTFIEQSMFYQH